MENVAKEGSGGNNYEHSGEEVDVPAMLLMVTVVENSQFSLKFNVFIIYGKGYYGRISPNTIARMGWTPPLMVAPRKAKKNKM